MPDYIIYYNTLITYGIARELLDKSLEKHVNLKLIAQLIQRTPTDLIPCFKNEWQLLILGNASIFYQNFESPFWKQRDNYGSSPLYYLAWAGNIEVLNWVEQNKPKLFTDSFIAHGAAISGQTAVLDWFWDHFPALLTNVERKYGQNIAHYAAMSNNPESLQWMSNKKPDLLNKLDYRDYNLAHIAATSPKADMIEWLCKSENYSHMLYADTALVLPISHVAAKSGSIEVLEWLLEHKGALLEAETYDGIDIANTAALSGNLKIFEWIVKHKPNLISIDSHHAIHSEAPITIIHCILISRNLKLFEYLLQEKPVLTKKIWINSQEWISPYTWETYSTLKLNQIRDSALHAATHRFLQSNSNNNDLDLFRSFSKEWQNILEKCHDLRSIVMENRSAFPEELQHLLKKLEPIHAITAFCFNEGQITRDQLRKLYNLVKKTQSIYYSYSQFFTHPFQPTLLQQLNQFINKLKLDHLNTRQIFCLQRIVLDYKQNLLDKPITTNHILSETLMATTTLSQLRPKTQITHDLDIQFNEFSSYLITLKERVNRLPLNNNTIQTMQEVIIPGIEAIIRDEDIIVEHVKTQYGCLYYLNEKLPLHTDHIPSADAEAYRQTLRRLLINLFGAVELAHNKGVLNQFCEKISTGYCFEGRVRDIFIWSASLSEAASFDRLMECSIYQEYLPYAEIMFDTPEEKSSAVEPVLQFILKRHLNQLCIPDAHYAPLGKVTRSGVKAYLEQVLDFTPATQTGVSSLVSRIRSISWSCQ